MDIEVLLQNNSALEAAMFDETPKNVCKKINVFFTLFPLIKN